MARILIAGDGNWYDELQAVAYYFESDVERWILQHARSVFPYHFVIPFKKDIVSRTTGSSKRPDLALIRRDFAAWAIVEVELGKHDLDHVLDQAHVFADGRYNPPEIAEYARQQLIKTCGKTAGLKRLTRLFSSETPSILVMADVHVPGWQEELGRTGIDFCVFEVYKSIAGRYIYRTFGQYPAVIAEKAHVRRGPIANTYEVVGPFTFKKITTKARITVTYEDRLTQWAVLQDGGRQYLRFLGTSNPLSPNDTYGLFRDKADRYSFKRI